jgi:hypothetical protein
MGKHPLASLQGTTPVTDHFDSSLEPWDAVATTSDSRPTLLLGNGFSTNLWDQFRYKNLFEQADLDAAVKALFDELDTSNFETVLECIHHARLTAGAIGQDTAEIETLYGTVRDALYATVRALHVAWSQFPDPACRAIVTALHQHRAVYTTSYDLSLYWSTMRVKPLKTVDFMWNDGNTFSPGNCSKSRGIPIYYLHGGLHLWVEEDGTSGKWSNSKRGGLLGRGAPNPTGKQLPDEGTGDARQPLFVSEGDSRSKVRTIHRSEYLTFCLDSLKEDDSDTVVFGHSLSSQDQHIVEALNAGPDRRLAISIYPHQSSTAIAAEKVRIRQQIRDGIEVVYFDSETHPLGDPALHIAEE